MMLLVWVLAPWLKIVQTSHLCWSLLMHAIYSLVLIFAPNTHWPLLFSVWHKQTWKFCNSSVWTLKGLYVTICSNYHASNNSLCYTTHYKIVTLRNSHLMWSVLDCLIWIHFEIWVNNLNTVQQLIEANRCLEKHWIIFINCFKICTFIKYGCDVNRAIAMSPPYKSQTDHGIRKKKKKHYKVFISI